MADRHVKLFWKEANVKCEGANVVPFTRDWWNWSGNNTWTNPVLCSRFRYGKELLSRTGYHGWRKNRFVCLIVHVWE